MVDDPGKIRTYITDQIRRKAIIFKVELGDIEDDFSLTGSGIFDSVDFVDLIANVESAFNVEVDFSEADPEAFTTLKGFINCIR